LAGLFFIVTVKKKKEVGGEILTKIRTETYRNSISFPTFPKHVPETLKKNPSLDHSDGVFFSVSGTCFGSIGKQVLLPYVSVPVSCFRKDFPPLLLPSFFFTVTTQKKSPAKKKRLFVIPWHSKSHRVMDNDEVQSVHETIWIVEQRPAQAQHREHHQQ